MADGADRPAGVPRDARASGCRAAYLGDGADQTYLRQAAVLEDWTFDRRRFQVPPHVYAACDPAHWLALETAAAALADAGLGAGTGWTAAGSA